MHVAACGLSRVLCVCPSQRGRPLSVFPQDPGCGAPQSRSVEFSSVLTLLLLFQWKKHWFVLADQSLRFYRDSVAEEVSVSGPRCVLMGGPVQPWGRV